MEAFAINEKLLVPKGIATRSDRTLLGALLLVTRTLLGAKGLTTSNKKLLVAPGITSSNKKLLGSRVSRRTFVTSGVRPGA